MPGMAPFEQRVAARFFRSGESARRLSRAFERRTVVSAAGPSLSHWPCMDMVAHWLPNDAKLDALPLLWLHGDDDRIVPLSGSRTGIEEFRGADWTERVYPGARHEVFNETNKAEVLADVKEFVDCALRR
jgi:alpha-beta hydrolase superfamily lysophospholipase